MKIELHSWTKAHDGLRQIQRMNRLGLSAAYPLAHATFGQATLGDALYADLLCEFAGRICYRSQDSLGKSSSFISARLAEGHEDIIEHASITLKVSETLAEAADSRFLWGQTNAESLIRRIRGASQYVYVTPLQPREWAVTANARAWREIQRELPTIPIATVLQAVAPKTFGDLAKTFASGDSGVVAISGETSPLIRRRGEYAPFVPVYALGENDFPVSLADAETDIQVTHLATNLPSIPISKYASQHATTTFLIEGISRSCTHQLVRHRRGSYSQESQRYVDLDKGKWNFIMPPSIRTNDRAASLYDAYLENLGSTYRNLREAGVRKEDARFILPNAAETRLVVTMPHDAWEHFVWLRALDKAAQWEIRTLGQIVLTHLNHIHPLAFAKAWETYVEKFRNS